MVFAELCIYLIESVRLEHSMFGTNHKVVSMALENYRCSAWKYNNGFHKGVLIVKLVLACLIVFVCFGAVTLFY